MPLKIRVTNLNKRFDLDLDFAEASSRRVLRYLGKADSSLEIIFLDDKRIRVLNRKYKRVNRSTDVLSFDLEGREFGADDFSGCIFISSDKAMTNSYRFGTGFGKELLLYIIHGILHLEGYDDGTPKEKTLMTKKEGEILKLLCARRGAANMTRRSRKKRKN
ncbi:rRNA maturation RNase YbeY [Candidatus Omnitrophota bacterium]